MPKKPKPGSRKAARSSSTKSRRKSGAAGTGRRKPAKVDLAKRGPTSRASAGTKRTPKKRPGSGGSKASKRKPVTRSSNKRTPAKRTDRRASKPGTDKALAGSRSSAAKRASEAKRGPARADSKPSTSTATPKPRPVVSSKDLSKLRGNLQLKQTHLAALLGVDTMTVSRWERRVLAPKPWHLELCGEFQAAVDKGFCFGLKRPSYYYTNRYDLAADEGFTLSKVPDRLREILVAAKAAKVEATIP